MADPILLPCEHHLLNQQAILSEQVHGDFEEIVSPSVGAEVAQILSTRKNPRTKARAAYAVYLRERLARLTLEDADRFRRLFGVEEGWDLQESPHLKGQYRLSDQVIEIQVPRDLQGTLADYFIRVHETEHALIWIKRGRALDLKTQGALTDPESDLWVEWLFLEEAKCIQAEWNFLHWIPESVRLRVAESVEARTDIPEAEKQTIIHALRSAGLPVREYLEGMWARGRHSMETLEARRLRELERFNAWMEHVLSPKSQSPTPTVSHSTHSPPRHPPR